MSKRLIWVVTIFMGLAMASLILVQAYWIRNAILVKKKQFDQLITRSMIDIRGEVERLEVKKISSRLAESLIADSAFTAQPLSSVDNDGTAKPVMDQSGWQPHPGQKRRPVSGLTVAASLSTV